MSTQHTLTRTALGLALAAGIAGVPATAQAVTSIAVAERSDQSTTTYERGLALECRGKAQGLRAYVEVYENSLYGNNLQVVLGGPDSGRGGGGATEADLVRKGRLTGNAKVEIDGKVAKVKGSAHKRGPRTAVHEEYDDAGQHITVTGTHRRMVTDMGVVYDGKRIGLTCEPAFGFNLKVVKEPVD